MKRTSITAQVLLGPLLISLAACAQGEPEIVEVETATNSGNVVFSWEGGNAHSLTVQRCIQECNGCVDGVLDYGGSEIIWKAADNPTGAPELASPMTYGKSSGAKTAQPLVSGVTYGVQIWTNEDCSPSACGAIVVEGCGEFVAP